ncbi:MAG: metallopeptidase family protein [Gemmatimonadota bacterium]
MVSRMATELPEEFLDGVAEIAVVPQTIAHPDRPDVYTLGECVPLPAAPVGGSPEAVQSRVVLYFGSFAAVARDNPDFDWRTEAWETLVHEVRHHVEWRAGAPNLEDLDEAVEANYARLAGEPFDPVFYRSGEKVAEGVFQVEDDYFIEVTVGEIPAAAEFQWNGVKYRLNVPAGVSPPILVSVLGLDDPPAGEVVVVVLSRRQWWQVFRPEAPAQLELSAQRVD